MAVTLPLKIRHVICNQLLIYWRSHLNHLITLLLPFSWSIQNPQPPRTPALSTILSTFYLLLFLQDPSLFYWNGSQEVKAGCWRGFSHEAQHQAEDFSGSQRSSSSKIIFESILHHGRFQVVHRLFSWKRDRVWPKLQLVLSYYYQTLVWVDVSPV